jgi:hypothetical protein
MYLRSKIHWYLTVEPDKKREKKRKEDRWRTLVWVKFIAQDKKYEMQPRPLAAKPAGQKWTNAKKKRGKISLSNSALLFMQKSKPPVLEEAIRPKVATLLLRSQFARRSIRPSVPSFSGP